MGHHSIVLGEKLYCTYPIHTLVGGVSGDMDLSERDTDPSLSLLLSPLLFLLLTGGSGLLILRFFSATSAIILPALSSPSPPPLALSLPLLFGSSLDFFTGGGLRSGLSFETLRCLLDCLLSSPDCLREVEGGGGFCLCFSLGGGEGEGDGEGEGEGRLFRFLGGGLGGDMERDDLEWVSDIPASDGELDRLLSGVGERRLLARFCPCRCCCCCCLELDRLISGTCASFLSLSLSLLSTPLNSLFSCCCLFLRSVGEGLLTLCLLSRPDTGCLLRSIGEGLLPPLCLLSQLVVTFPFEGFCLCGLGEGERELAESDLLSSVPESGLGDL